MKKPTESGEYEAPRIEVLGSVSDLTHASQQGTMLDGQGMQTSV